MNVYGTYSLEDSGTGVFTDEIWLSLHVQKDRTHRNATLAPNAECQVHHNILEMWTNRQFEKPRQPQSRRRRTAKLLERLLNDFHDEMNINWSFIREYF